MTTTTELETVEVETLSLDEIRGDAPVDIQIATAKRYPRNVEKALSDALSLATMDEETAAAMSYHLPRGDGIDGPGVRLAEVMAHSWGNLRVDAGVESVGEKSVTAVATCMDLEKNVAVRVRVQRSILTSKGHRYSDDMIVVTGNAATAVAFRNSVFKIIPAVFVKRVWEAARTASFGRGASLETRRSKAMTWFSSLGVRPEVVFETLGVTTIEDIDAEKLHKLLGMATAIKEGDATLTELFGPGGGRKVRSEASKNIDSDLGGE